MIAIGQFDGPARTPCPVYGTPVHQKLRNLSLHTLPAVIQLVVRCLNENPASRSHLNSPIPALIGETTGDHLLLALRIIVSESKARHMLTAVPHTCPLRVCRKRIAPEILRSMIPIALGHIALLQAC